MNRQEWITAFAREVGVELPSAAEIDELLNLASTAAHASERPAAPLACFIAGRSGKSIAELHEAAARINPA